MLWIPAFAGMTVSIEGMTEVVLAQEKQDFASAYDITYDVAEDGITTVTEKITLRNLTSQYYATEFNSLIGATNITEVVRCNDSAELIAEAL